MRKWALALAVIAGAIVAIAPGRVQSAPTAPVAPVVAPAPYRFPLRMSANHRYLVDQRDQPFLVVGDSPQAMIGDLSVEDAATFIANRRAAGFNALWVSLLCVKLIGCRDDASTFDGIKPFRVTGSLSTPNPEYFKRARAIIRLAANAGLVVFLGPIETSGWLDVLRSNGEAKAFSYGQFVGRQFKGFRNIVWLNGNDFQSWNDAKDDAVVLAVARGIRSTDPGHLQTVELNYFKSGSLDDPRWRPLIGASMAYTYHPTYEEVLHEYNRKAFLPVVMLEAGYEFEQNVSWISKGDPEILRRQAYWSVLSGAAGQFYGNRYTWQFADGWKEHLDTPGSAQMGYLKKLLAGQQWFRLVPDQAHKIVTDGFGTFSTAGNVASSDYATTSATHDGTLVISYLPTGGTLTLDTTRLGKRLRARWYDPTNGLYRPASNSRLPRSHSIHLTAPKRNAAGDRDWVLVLTTR